MVHQILCKVSKNFRITKQLDKLSAFFAFFCYFCSAFIPISTMKFQLQAPFAPGGDQPGAIKQMVHESGAKPTDLANPEEVDELFGKGRLFNHMINVIAELAGEP